MTLARHWASQDGRFEVLLRAKAASELERLLRDVRALETGGILIGSYDDQHRVATIDEVTAPPRDSKAGPTWFRRGTEALTELLRRRWRAARRTYYLGDWHHHPADNVFPSDDDVAQLHALAKDPSYRCPEPLMLIVGQSVSGARNTRLFVSVKGTELIELIAPARR